jgi:hypothetical protein
MTLFDLGNVPVPRRARSRRGLQVKLGWQVNPPPETLKISAHFVSIPH